MRNYRSLRVGSVIHKELNKLIAREIELEGALATVTDVAVDKKLERAQVYVSILPTEKAEKSMAVFKNNQGRLQHLLMKKLNIRPMPRIEFVLDRGLEHAAKIEKTLLENQ